MTPLGRGAARLRPPVAAALVLFLLGALVVAAHPSGATPSGGFGLTGMFGGSTTVAGSTTPTRNVALDERTTSAVTVRGVGKSAGLKLTVSQTTNLVNQTIDISWTGGTATRGLPSFSANYLQIMQCWGDKAPNRTQCQFGGKTAFDTRGGENASARKLNQSTYLDPKEELAEKGDTYVPFTAVDGKTVSGIDTLKNPYFDQSTSNEIPFAATRGDGSGFESFEVQTYREAPGLGCGDVIASGTQKGKIRNCWLVVVPRGETEVDGSPWPVVEQRDSHRLDTSPLSATNWERRIVVPLKFTAAAAVCSIAAQQLPLVGAETAAESVLRWQPALCAKSGPVFSYTTLADAVVERKLMGSAPGMGLLTAPVPPARVSSDRQLSYAPLAVSGIGISFLVERQSAAGAAAAVKARDGERITELNLTPRLVAKLVTQSYLLDVGEQARYLKTNPRTVAEDPEFLKYNKAFRDLNYRDSIETLLPIGLSDSNSLLWDWIAQDQEARDFVAGTPDPWGMRVNPFYQGLDVPRDDFSKVDPFCERVVADAPALCTLDRHPYALDFHESARAVSRGDSLARTNWDVNGTPPAWKKSAPQLNGQRQILALSDTATAARFGLLTARLRNASGAFVAPDRTGLRAALAAMRTTSVPGVLAPDPAATGRAVYPLTHITYGVTPANILTPAAAKDYAGFIRFAVRDGQRPGTGAGDLPDGYLPLTPALRSRALQVADDVQSRKGPKPSPGGDPDGGNSDGGSDGDPDGGGVTGGTGTDSPATTPADPVGAASPTATPAVTAVEKTTLLTPGISAVATRYGLLAALALGTCALVIGLLLPRLARRLGR